MTARKVSFFLFMTAELVCILSLQAFPDVAITGSVHDEAGNPIRKALIKLVVAGKSTTSDSAGSFSFLGAAARHSFSTSNSYGNAPFLAGHVLHFSVFSPSENVRVAVYDLLGRMVHSAFDGVLPHGGYAVMPFAPGLAANVYCIVIKTGKRSHVIKMPLVGKPHTVPTLSKHAAGAAVPPGLYKKCLAVDTLVVSAQGYYIPQRIPVESYSGRYDVILSMTIPVLKAANDGILLINGCRDLNKDGSINDYENWRLPVETRVKDLLARMTVAEKVGQIRDITYEGMDSLAELKIRDEWLGSIFFSAVATQPSRADVWIEKCNYHQRLAAQTQLGIPLLYGCNSIHGNSVMEETVIFPHQIGLGATWNPELVEDVGRITAIETRVAGPNWNQSPVADVARSNLWGRTYESFGEDPYLCSVLIRSEIKGYHSLPGGFTLAGCPKHFLASGHTEGGRTVGNVEVTDGVLREVDLPPYIAAIEEGVQSLMTNYCSIRGVEMEAHKTILTDWAKGELGFDGFFVTDWMAIDNAASTYREAIKISVNAGIDMVMVPDFSGVHGQFGELAADLVDKHEIPMGRLDDAVTRILRVKFQLGAFENPYVEVNSTALYVNTAEHRETALKAVRESIVLLKNDTLGADDKTTLQKGGPLLPLPKDIKRICCAGPNADNIRNQCGGWTLGWQGAGGVLPQGTSIAAAIRSAVSATAIVDFVPSDAALAKQRADSADVAVVVLGETPYAETGGDINDLALSSLETSAGGTALFDSVVSTGVPTVLVLVTGRPRVLEGREQKARAILAAWLPGAMGAGVADVIFGDFNPGGRLTRSWPATNAQSAIAYDRRPGEAYAPLYEFGHGLSYTSFEYENLSVSPAIVGITGEVTIGVTVKNTGGRKGDEVVMIFYRDLVSTIPTPVKKLCRFKKISLEPGHSVSVTFVIPVRELGYHTDGPERVLEPGEFSFMVGNLTGSCTVQ